MRDDIQLRRSIRIVQLLDAAEMAGMIPLAVEQLHLLAYLSNVLAQVWELTPIDGKLLKRESGPFYSALQRDLDKLVGAGVVAVTKVAYVREQEGKWRLESEYRLNSILAHRITTRLAAFEAERRVQLFLNELAFAMSALASDELSASSRADPTYANPVVDVGSVIDFAEWRNVNFTATATRRFERAYPSGVTPTRAELLHLYARHLHHRLNAAH